MALNFDARAFMAPGGVTSGLDDLGSAVVTALNRRAERKSQSEAAKAAAAQAAASAAARRAQEVEDRDLGIKTRREEQDITYKQTSEQAAQQAAAADARAAADREFKAAEAEKERMHQTGLAQAKANSSAARLSATSALTRLPPEEVKAAYLAAGLSEGGKFLTKGVGGFMEEGPPPPEIASRLDAEFAARRKRLGIGGVHDAAAVRGVMTQPDDAPAAPAPAAGSAAAPAPAPAAAMPPEAVVSARDQLLAGLDQSRAKDPNADSTIYQKLRDSAAAIKTQADLDAWNARYGKRVRKPAAAAVAPAPAQAPVAPAQPRGLPPTNAEFFNRAVAESAGLPDPTLMPPSGPPMPRPAPPAGPMDSAAFFNRAVEDAAMAEQVPFQSRPAARVSPAPGEPLGTAEQFNQYLAMPDPADGSPMETQAFAPPSPMPLPGEELGMPGDPPQSLSEALERGAAERQATAATAPAQGNPLQFKDMAELNLYMQWLSKHGLPYGTPPPPGGLEAPMGIPVPAI